MILSILHGFLLFVIYLSDDVWKYYPLGSDAGQDFSYTGVSRVIVRIQMRFQQKPLLARQESDPAV
jgi:hypothetical protein